MEYNSLSINMKFYGLPLIFLLIASSYTFAEGSPERNYPNHRKYRSEKPDDYKDVGFGLFISSRLNRYDDYFYLYYNESYNDNIKSPFKINENIAIDLVGYQYIADPNDDYYNSYIKVENINYKTNNIEIIISNQYHKEKTYIPINLYFDENNHRLVSMVSAKYFSGSEFESRDYCGEYIYEYDYEGRMDAIYAVYDWGKVLRKKYYYDGKPRRLYRPYFIDTDTTGLEEIAVYDGTFLRYTTKLYSGGGGPLKLTMEQQERNHHFTITEFDKNYRFQSLIEIRSIAYYEGADWHGIREELIKTLYLREGYNDEPIEFVN